MVPEPISAAAPEDLERTYERRFSPHDVAVKDTLWREVCGYLQRYIPRDGAVLDVACDQGAFIRNIDARERWATDLRDVSGNLPPDIRFVQIDGPRMSEALPHNHFAVVFMSNYLEHLASPEVVVDQLRAAHIVLRPGGLLMVLQPNIRLTGNRYWDFLDHKTALTEKSLEEAADLAGFEKKKMVTRFLPYSTKSRLPQADFLVRAYLKFPPAWLLMGKQTLYLGIKPSRS